jgi:hypothetical protein
MKYMLADRIGEDLVKTMDLIFSPVPYGLKEYFGKAKCTVEHADNENVSNLTHSSHFYWECVCIDAIANYRSDLELVAKPALVYEQLIREIGELGCDLLTQIATERLECFEERVNATFVLTDKVEILKPS